MKKLLSAVAVAAALTASAGARADVIIDMFDVDQNQITDYTKTDTTGVWSTVTGPTSSIIGAYRELYVERTGGTGSEIAANNASAYVADSAYSFGSQPKVAGFGVIRWDGAGAVGELPGTTYASNGMDFLLGADLSGLTDFIIDVESADQGFTFTLALYKSATEYSIITLVSSGAVGLRYIPIAGFLAGTGCYPDPYDVNEQVCVDNNGLDPTDLADIGAIEATINPDGGTLSLDLSIRSATAVPEPASLALVGLGLFGLGAIRRRRSVK